MIIKTKNAEFDSESIFTPIDVFTKKAEIDQFINDAVYTADTWKVLLKNIEKGFIRYLSDISTDPQEVMPFITRGNAKWHFCLPAIAVKFKTIEPKKEYRPFKTFTELSETLNVDLGGVITWRYKVDSDLIHPEIITGIMTNLKGELISISLAETRWSIKSLFENTQYLSADGQWHTFGIENKE